ncbi:hypothetical protein [Gelidibacter japonicus]|uniref:hypothetical protein n=1 Tax=Gelidibacter japonicus TaxID=1962232 RepID=UPI002AFE317A|nr:hypothetical protein [Gelidibacter japonicus]
MKKLPSLLIILVLTLHLLSCSKKDDPATSALCDEFVIINNDMFKNRLDDDGTGRNGFEIISAEFIEDCLVIGILTGGCTGDTIEMDLVDAGRVSETSVLQRDLNLFIDNTELCNAIVGKTMSFDLTPLRTQNKEITLNLERWDGQLIYAY